MPGSPLDSSAEMMKYDAAPTIAPSAHSTPTALRAAPEMTSSTSTRPQAARTAPSTVSREGRCPWRSQSHMTTATGAVYSSNSATLTCM